ncbi:MAG: TolC family protein, partial [Elusimicrobia bacterium]|nr:TolC family protein [Elusimicrobiota bacterium]
VRLTWSLFSGGGTLADYRESKKRKEKAQADLLAVEREVGIQIAESYSGIHSSLEQLKALDQGVAASAQVLHAMEKGYASGARTLAQVLDSRRDLLEAKRLRSETFYKALMSQFSLHLAVSEFDFLED